MRWQSLVSKRFVRSLSTPRSTQNLESWADELHTLHKHERIALSRLKIECDDLLYTIEGHCKPQLRVAESVETSLLQKRYICTEKVNHASEVVRFLPRLAKNIKEIQAHCDDLEREPHPDWKPGDEDTVTRQIKDPNLTRQELEHDALIKQQDTEVTTKHLYSVLHDAESVYQAFKKGGNSAALACADELMKVGDVDLDKPLPLPALIANDSDMDMDMDMGMDMDKDLFDMEPASNPAFDQKPIIDNDESLKD